MTIVSAPGSGNPETSENDVDLGLLAKAKPSVDLLGSLRVDASRSGGDPAKSKKTEPDTIVELILEGDLRWITTVETLEADFPELTTRSTRAGKADGEFRLPTHLGATTLRGGVGDGLKVLEALVFDLDFNVDKLIGEIIGKVGEFAGGKAGPAIAAWFDQKQAGKRGLFRIGAIKEKENGEREASLDPLGSVADDPKEQPYLLFLHGTASTTNASFGGLWDDNATVWGNITERYQDRILALEHYTLSESPIANALAVAKNLPEKATLHIVSHSRGGMIGELLCRTGRTGDEVFDEHDLELLKEEAYAKEKDQLEKLKEELTKKSIKVERFVRVACPAAGTTLADGKLDRWLSALMNVLGAVGETLPGGLYDFIRGFTLAVVKTRTKPEDIPGLEAMMPGSPLTKILNRPDIFTDADLSVIAGDIEGEGALQRLAVWLTDLFYQGDHDLVVDTASMYGGQKRLPGKARSFPDAGPQVYHFRYFKNEKTASKVWDGLRRPDPENEEETPADNSGFLPLPSPPELKELLSRSGEPRPSVFILPGILGSELGYGKNRIWMDLKDVFRGRLERLDLHREKPKEIEAFRMFPRYYNELANFLAASHDVLPFPYDWRISMCKEADRFAGELTNRLDGSSQPVRILAHSMGGLVARLAFARHGDLWQRFKAKEGCRLIMLGTPNSGSFSIPRMLMGKEETTGLLALVDIKNSEKDLLNMIRRFPGMLELLPAHGHDDFFDGQIWKALDDAEGKGWQEPVESDLATARETWRVLDHAPLDGTKMVFVAGQAKRTPVGLTIDGQKVRFQATAQGDGRVPWSTIPKDLPTFYTDAGHGDLPRHEKAFGAYLDLLQQGTTRLLSNKQPVDRGAAMSFELPDDTPSIYPDIEALEAAALGSRARYATPTSKVRPLTIQVRHVDLAFSRFPVMLGHYDQDSLNGPERYLDKKLDQRLSNRYQRSLYPGRIDTAEVVLDDRALPPGAVVIGLGDVGELTVGKLRRAILHGLRRYCLLEGEKRARLAKDEDEASDSKSSSNKTSKEDVGISTLIIGSGQDGMTMKQALSALLDAVLELQHEGSAGDLQQIEIIELWEHRAISAMRELETLHKSGRYDGQFDIHLKLLEGEGSQRQLVLDQDQGWSQRISIKEMKTAHGLEFAVLTGEARIEDSVVADTLKLADAFIDAAIEQSHFTGRASPGRTLFELLLPRRLKLASDEDRNLVLMLDRFAAGFPWELLEDGSGDDAKPPAIRAGLIRQLHDEYFRPDVITTARRTALVIGDPEPARPHPKFAPLDGAVHEAETVAGLINRAGYAVDEEIRTKPTAAIAALMSGNYRIMHLAGHGVFEESMEADEAKTEDNDTSKKPKDLQTGMVLGDGLFLTAGAVDQLTHVPELVFLNCCYLGQINARAEKEAVTRYHELAANLATQFIRIGAKAVIAAGWAVDDSAANTFATTFYEAMLDGRATFMEAVQEARRQTYVAHPNTNTWGAYQAYGDPSYTLNGKKPNAGNGETTWYQPYEAVLAFGELVQRAQAMVQNDLVSLRGEFDELWRCTRTEWRDKSEILAVKAKAAGELGLFETAIDTYDQAIAGKQSDAPIRAIEQRANLRARYAVFLKKGKVQPGDKATLLPLQMIEQSIKELEDLKTLQRIGDPEKDEQKDNSERLNILGSAAKRACQLYVSGAETAAARDKKTDLPDEEQIGWLKISAGYYWKAHGLKLDDAYALTNWLSIAAVITLRGGKLQDKAVQPPSLAKQEELLSDAASAEKLADQERPNFWSLVKQGDIALTRMLVNAEHHVTNSKKKKSDTEEGKKKEFKGFIDWSESKIIKSYTKAWRRGGSYLRMNSTREQLDFLTDALSIGNRYSMERRELMASIRRIDDAIEKEMAPSD